MEGQPGCDNGLIKLLPDEERRSFTEHLERVYLPQGHQIAQAGKALESVYFLSSGIGSVLAVSDGGLKAEAGMFGREGFAPTASSVGANTNPYDIVIQVEGFAHRLPVVLFQEIVAENRVFADLLSRYLYVFAAQVAYTALANAAFKIDQRLARWLLMCHDRLVADNMPITHQFISLMLAVRRPSVTTALHMLEGDGLIRSDRGRVVLRDRPGLEEYSAGSYGQPEQEYRVLLQARHWQS
ncbi:Crp/Fnr family transcriptional regulator [Rhizobium leguminosarum]|uniref:Crp/Fnr family transcriptional regulator n=2 Tax=Rhizobium leguminosarum TaxID=384 RepID=A0A154IMR7_RHILE|nr:Crp/Fnr family transcriptional regulator [Rhizobium leguminosarum]KZB01897.1 Crp/Fnr family transcriptional regulator [Rhizobium leguminosarum]